MIGSNDKIGKADVNLTTVADGVCLDQWIKLTKAKHGEVRVQTVWTPKPLAKKSDPVRLPSFRLVMERTTYVPGETIRGMIVLNVRATQLPFQLTLKAAKM